MTYFFDRTFGRSLPLALGLLDLPVELHDTYYAQDTPDDEWLPEVAAKGWVILTEDRLERNELATRAILDHKAACWIVRTSPLRRRGKAEFLLRHWDRIEAIARRETAPYVMRLDPRGKCTRLLPEPRVDLRVDDAQ